MAEKAQHILEPGGTEVTTAAGGARRYRKPLTSFRWRDIRALFEESFAGWSDHNAPRLGAALSFYTLWSIAPLLVILVSAVGMVWGHQAAETAIIRQVDALAGPIGVTAARYLLEGSHNTANGIIATVFGLFTLLFGASAVMVELRSALDTIWDAPAAELRGLKMIAAMVKQRLFSFALILAVGFLLVVSLAVSAWISALGAASAAIFPGHEILLHIFNITASFTVVTGLFSAIYKFLPQARIEWRDVVLGGAVTSVLFTIGKFALGIYLGKATFASAYGAAASIVLMIVWVYYSAQIFFLGAEFTKVFAERYGSQPSRHPDGMVIASDRAAKPVGDPRIITPVEAKQRSESH
jgi:membrane protein